MKIDTSKWSYTEKMLHIHYIAECSDLHSDMIAVKRFREALYDGSDLEDMYLDLEYGVGRFKG